MATAWANRRTGFSLSCLGLRSRQAKACPTSARGQRDDHVPWSASDAINAEGRQGSASDPVSRRCRSGLIGHQEARGVSREDAEPLHLTIATSRQSESDDGGEGLVMAVNPLDQDFHGRPLGGDSIYQCRWASSRACCKDWFVSPACHTGRPSRACRCRASSEIRWMSPLNRLAISRRTS